MIKSYDLLMSFGCSFTEGGGLNNPNYHRYLSGDTDLYKPPFVILPCYNEYMNHHSYPGYLSRLLNCPYINEGTSCASNELILKKVYDTFKDWQDDRKILVTIQSSILSRILLYLTDEKRYINLNRLHDLDEDVKKYYESYLTMFFDIQNEYQKLVQNIDLYTNWLSSKNIDMCWILYDIPTIMPTGTHIVNFENQNLRSYAHGKKLTLTDLPNFPYDDKHFSITGNEIIANIIYNHMSNYHD